MSISDVAAGWLALAVAVIGRRWFCGRFEVRVRLLLLRLGV